jgi:hypothetical protein
MAERADRDESKNLPADNQGSSPGAPPASAGAMPQRQDLPSPSPKSEPPLPEGGVSWEERRKGLPPEEVENLDEALYAERFASEQQTVNDPNPAWRPTRESPEAPDWPPSPNGRSSS